MKQDALPFYGKAHPIPLKQLELIKNEVYRQCEIGDLRELKGKDADNRPWAFPAFGVAKKNGTIQLVIDFRKLNTMCVRLEYPLPTIDGLIQSIVGFKFETGLDLIIGYLSMPLDEPSKTILAIIMPFGPFECQVLPQGVEPATNIFQGLMTSLFSHLKKYAPKIYLDNVLHTCGNSFDNHLKHLDTILEVLKKAGMQVNAKKEHLVCNVLRVSWI